MVMNDVEILEKPIKSTCDKKQYRLIKLVNGLKVLLVKNVENSSSAVALSVDVGSFDDPLEIQGLSHFLEHMVGDFFLLIKKIKN